MLVIWVERRCLPYAVYLLCRVILFIYLFFFECTKALILPRWDSKIDCWMTFMFNDTHRPRVHDTMVNIVLELEIYI